MGFTLWFTGLPGSGKTTVAEIIKKKFLEKGMVVELIESDDIAKYYKGLFNFDSLGRNVIVRNMAVCAELLNKNGVKVIATSTTPLKKDRDSVRAVISSLILIHCNASEKTARMRDPKGLYKMADKGIISDFPGPGGLYEPPLDAEIELDTDGLDKNQSVENLLMELSKLGLIPG